MGGWPPTCDNVSNGAAFLQNAGLSEAASAKRPPGERNCVHPDYFFGVGRRRSSFAFAATSSAPVPSATAFAGATAATASAATFCATGTASVAGLIVGVNATTFFWASAAAAWLSAIPLACAASLSAAALPTAVASRTSRSSQNG